MEKFVARTKAIKIGDPMHMDTQMGAIIHSRHLDACLDYVEIGKKEGGKFEAFFF